MKIFYLNKIWRSKKAGTDCNWKNAVVPGNIYLDLLYNKEISDPYYRISEQAQFVFIFTFLKKISHFTNRYYKDIWDKQQEFAAS